MSMIVPVDCGDTPCQCLDNQCLGCTADDQCMSGFCEGNACVECRADGDCEAGDFCAANTCVGCRDNADCNDGNVCIDSECVPPPPGDSCADPSMYEVGTVVRGSTQNFENCFPLVRVMVCQTSSRI